ncbi:hypothetical protein L1987_76047 [Smallanthus sonchifolius]|uniref:Uncharacterized protein n=1 Tax=Smallanthus sonchifolius TaxID=185202 RepID=A0ACB9ABJ1_9ASTR|nr:hypothetical protein L1987_76047 [Smallanthus sonchifolius]
METTFFSMEFNFLSSLFLFATPLFLLFVACKYFTSVTNLPPGPRPWPIIGNMHQMAKNPHIAAANFAMKYGPLISLRLGKVVKIEELIFTTLINTLSNILFSKDFLDLKDVQTAHLLKFRLLKMLKNSVTPNVSDFFPIVGGLDLQGLRRDSLHHYDELSRITEAIVKERRAQSAKKVVLADHEKDFLDRLLENNFTTAQINTLVVELFTAGTETVVTATEWAMAEFLKNKEIMCKVREELTRELNTKNIMKSDLSKFTYFNACIKETLRFHPVVPVLIPRRALEPCEVMNYTIPQNAQVWVNVWAISHDPKVWEDPYTFKPERFLGSNIDFTGHDFEFIPFGGGRRMCPGLPSGVKSLQTMLASLIVGYNWSLPNGEDPAKLDMTEKFGVTLQKEKPLELIFCRRE